MAPTFIRLSARHTLGLLVVLSLVLLVPVLLTPAAAVQANSVVVGDGVHAASCNMFSLGKAMNNNTTADITFSCGGPATIVITQGGGLNAVPGKRFKIDGGNVITISGIDAYRMFAVHGSGVLTLANMILTHGYAASGGAYPTQGGAILNEDAYLALDHVTVRDSRAIYSAGGIEATGGTTLVKDSLIENNRSVYGGGIDSLSQLTLINTTVRANEAITGGGLDVGGVVVISASQVYSNTADASGGGLYVASGASVTINGSQFYRNFGGGTFYGAGTGGGAIANRGFLRINNSLLSGNSTLFSGGGILNADLGEIELHDSLLSGNQASDYGGAIHDAAEDLVQHSRRLSVVDSTFSGNMADFGGGLSNVNAAVAVVLRTTFRGNVAHFYGGGLINDNTAVVDVYETTFSGNSAANGGGVFNSVQAATSVENSTLSSNTSSNFGGGLYNLGQASLRNATLSNNSASAGGAAYMGNTAATVVTNTILAYSPSGGNCNGTLTSSKHTLSSDLTCGLPITDTIKGNSPNGLDPLLTILANYGGPTWVHMLKLGSPAIDGIVGSDAPLNDQRGRARPIGIGFDIGAVERQTADSNLAPWLYLPLLRR